MPDIRNVGISPKVPTDYVGAMYSFPPIYKGPRRPTTTDRKEQFAFWRVMEPSLAAGEFWYLSKYSSGDAIWVLVTASVADPILGVITDTSAIAVTSDDDGNITLTGGQIAAGLAGVKAIRINKTSTSAYAVEIQRASAAAVTDPTFAANGIAHFNSAQFTVDANGFVSSISGGFVWIDQSISAPAIAQTGYFTTAAITMTLPAAPAQGDTIQFSTDTAGVLTILANAGQQIRLGNSITAVAGNLKSTAQGDTIELVYRTVGTTWHSVDSTGNFIIT